jgi:hypothetical protein
MAVAERVSRLRVEWVSDDLAYVHVQYVMHPPYPSEKIGELYWNTEVWLWSPWTPDAIPLNEEEAINVDPDEHRTLVEEKAKILRGFAEGHEPLLAELRGRFDMLRDDTRDIAAVGAKVKAKRWQPRFERMAAGYSETQVQPARDPYQPAPSGRHPRAYNLMKDDKLLQCIHEMTARDGDAFQRAVMKHTGIQRELTLARQEAIDRGLYLGGGQDNPPV